MLCVGVVASKRERDRNMARVDINLVIYIHKTGSLGGCEGGGRAMPPSRTVMGNNSVNFNLRERTPLDILVVCGGGGCRLSRYAGHSHQVAQH